MAWASHSSLGMPGDTWARESDLRGSEKTLEGLSLPGMGPSSREGIGKMACSSHQDHTPSSPQPLKCRRVPRGFPPWLSPLKFSSVPVKGRGRGSQARLCVPGGLGLSSKGPQAVALTQDCWPAAPSPSLSALGF